MAASVAEAVIGADVEEGAFTQDVGRRSKVVLCIINYSISVCTYTVWRGGSQPSIEVVL